MSSQKLEHAITVCREQLLESVEELRLLESKGKLERLFKPIVYDYIADALRDKDSGEYSSLWDGPRNE